MNTEQAIGAVLRDKYEILSTLGEGGFGTVYKARQIATGQPVAIKVLRLAEGGSGQDHEKRIVRFQREMQLCAQMHHPNIVRLIDSGRAEGDVVYTIFEFAPGKDLAQVIADEGRLDPQEAKHLMLQVLDALSCAHAQGVVHRDLKPANLMIIPTGARRNALVLDFGIGAVTDEARQSDQAKITLTSESIGTPSYAAPEQLRGHPPTPRSDLYAWGLVFLECLTGKRVVEGETVAEVVFKQLSPDPIPIPTAIANHPLGSIIRRVTSKDPTARDVTAEGLLRDLEACDVSGLRPRTAPTRMQPSAPNAATETVEVSSALRTSQRLVEGERRQITAMCCTLSASGVGATAADPEELDQILGLLQEAFVGVARRFGGHVAGALGDTLLFYFGYPTAREDDARRAARAALALAAEVRSRSETLEAERQVRVDVRVGIHTGLVVARELRDPTITGLGYVVGTTPKLATRLSALAAPGSVVLSGETRRLLRKDFLIEAAGVSPAEGGAPALETYVLHEGKPASGLDDIPLVGREREIDRLFGYWTQARAGSGQVVLIGGEPGIGKSRLARELGERIAEEAHTWLECRCTPDSANTAFYPIVDLLDRMLDPNREIKPESKIEKLEALLSLYGFELSEAMPLFSPLLSFTLPKRWTPLDVSPQRQRELTRNAVLSLLFEIADREPVVLVIEDLHWADPSTLELLGHFVGDVASSRVLALFTARPEFTPTWSPSAVHSIQLGRLGRPEVEQMGAKITGGRALPDEVVSQIATRTDGVPLFVEELVRTMIESGALVEQGDRYALSRPLSELSIPTTLRDSLVARLDRLGRAKETAQVASAIGREFTLELLRAVSPLDEAAAEEDLDKLVAAELVYRKRRLKNPAYLFKHALVRDAAYDSMLNRSRRDVHARIAKAIEDKFVDLVNERPELLAHHHAAAEQKREALGYGHKAASKALQRSANLEAIVHGQSALQWLPAIADATERATTELALNGAITPALMMTRGYGADEVEAIVQRSQALLDQLGDGPDAFPTLWALWGHNELRGRHAIAMELAQRNLALADRTGDVGKQVVANIQVGHNLFFEGQWDESRRHFDRALALYDLGQHREHAFVFGQDSAVHAQGLLGQASWFSGYPDLGLAQAKEALKRARDLNHANSIGMALYYLTAVHHFRRETEAVRTVTDELLEFATRNSLPVWMVCGKMLRGWADNDPEGPRQILAGLKAMGFQQVLPYFTSLSAEADAALGNLDGALACLEECLRLADEKREPYYVPELLRLKATYVLQRGGPEAALAVEPWLERAMTLARSQGARMLELRAAMTLWRARGPRDDLRARLSELSAWFTDGLELPEIAEARRLFAGSAPKEPGSSA